MIAGRKLLLADDSLAIQKVIDLTFTDEGMEVATTGDGDDAWEKLEQFAPDVVLADVFMPGTNGYGLCERIKQNERFGRIPVILLVGSFEPFDEAEARRVGADDVVTKPFQSIRQLVSRVGSLMGSKPRDPADSRQPSTLGLEMSPANAKPEKPEQSQVTVLVEAPALESAAVVEKTCQPDIELQTADTQQLPSVTSDVSHAPESQPRLDVAPAYMSHETVPMGAQQMNATMNQTGPQSTSMEMTDALLDLDDFQTSVDLGNDDFVLELEDELPSGQQTAPIFTNEEAEYAEIIESDAGDQPATRFDDHAPEVAVVAEPTAPSNVNGLSPEIVDAIARRVVEHLSDRVVREIAWEVVPELAELMIKQRLEEQKQ